jgi:aspartate/methionine/tyrosine aminotransferase
MAHLAGEQELAGGRVIRLSQAVPWYGPPQWALDALAVHDPVVHRYSADPGLADVRELVCRRWFADRGFTVDSEGEIHLTCGASQAFLSALTVVADPGRRIVLTDPYYFDHLFAVQFLALEPRFVAMREDDTGFSLDVDGILREIKSGCAAVVIVDPANPTGSVMTEEELRLIATECAASGCALIIDETYEKFTFMSPRSWHPLQESSTRGVTLLIGSFSKSIGMAGWRLGYLVGPQPLLQQALKVHDSVAICAPVIAQALLSEALAGPIDEWLGERYKEVLARKVMAETALSSSRFLNWRHIGGGIFSLLAYDGTASSLDVAAAVLQKAGVAVVPGSAFGHAGEGHLRMSFGSSGIGELQEALERLGRFEL